MKNVNLLCMYISIRFAEVINIPKKYFILLKVCTKDWYGLDCKQQCSGHCRDNVVCNHMTGQCDVGCAAGWTGSKCNKGKLKFSSLTLFLSLTFILRGSIHKELFR